VDPALFLADLEAKPDALASLAARLAAGSPWPPAATSARRLVLTGMGSSLYAASLVAARMRARGGDAVADFAGSDLLPPVTPDDAVIAVSAGGGSRETAAAVERYRGQCPVVLLTNTPSSPLASRADHIVAMRAGPERGGVACRSYQHTLALLLALDAAIGQPGPDVAALVATAAAATGHLLDTRRDWLPEVASLLDGPDGSYVVAPARRLASAQQSALMLREGPRVPAHACETSDWSHVDVYLTKTLDYRMLLLAGSQWEDELLRWTSERDSTVIGVGADVPGAAATVRYPGDDTDDVRLLTEVIVAELIAAALWSDRATAG
jgi:glutamine---fructose-6-phosphate transaminase (isomerizing)